MRYRIITRIILVRHGETDWNKEKIFRGWMDLPLNSTGLKQAKATGEVLSHYKIDAIYSSPLRRAMDTAKAISLFHPRSSVKEEKGFLDMHFGSWEGLSLEKVKEKHRDLYNMWEREPHSMKMPDGEGLDDVKLRAFQALNTILIHHENEIIVIHYGTEPLLIQESVNTH